MGFFEKNPTCGLFIWLMFIIVMSILITEYHKNDSSYSNQKDMIYIYFGKYDQALKAYDEMKKLMPNDTTIDMKIDRLNKLIYDDA